MIKKSDFILAGVLLVVGIAILICMNIFRKNGGYAEVYVDGELKEKIALSDSGIYKIETASGTNVVVIEDGEAYVSEADCPDRLCVNMGHISKNGDNIVCVPHKLVVQISNAEKKEYDAR
ncbi:MAG: NusG domain II-containing protein [Coprococcus sp.]